MDLPRELLLRVLVPFLTLGTADRCLAGCGIREFDTCITAVVAPRAGPVASSCTRASPPISVLPVRSASICTALPRPDAMSSVVPRDVTFSCEVYVVLLILVTSFVPEKNTKSPRWCAAWSFPIFALRMRFAGLTSSLRKVLVPLSFAEFFKQVYLCSYPTGLKFQIKMTRTIIGRRITCWVGKWTE